MDTVTEPTVTVSIRVPASLRDQLDAIVRATGRDGNDVAQEALRRYVDADRRYVAMIEARLRQADEGQFATDEQMNELWAEFGVDPDADTGSDTESATY